MKENKSIKIIITSFSICLVISIGFYVFYLGHLTISESKTDVWGQFGDYIGGVIGTIVAIFTGILLILTLNSQNQTKNDNFFYYLIQLNETQLSKLNGKFGNDKFYGKEFLRKLVEETRINYHIYKNKNSVKEILVLHKATFNSYINISNEILKFIKDKENDISLKPIISYLSIFKSQLSNDEKIIIGYFIYFDLLSQNYELVKFYKDHRLNNTIDYEEGVNEEGKSPDAIKEFLEIQI